MSNWEGVNEFVAVAETESFTIASKRLGISAAQVSRQVSSLENRLGTKLFYRTTRKVSVTEMGSIYYQHCRQVLDSLEDAERAISNLQKKPQGKLRITAPITYGEDIIAPLLHDFILQYPDIQLHLELTNQKIDLIEQRFDLAIRLGKLEDSGLMSKQLSTRTRYVCASHDYLTSSGTPHVLSELAHHNCLRGNLDYWRFQEKGKKHIVRINGSIHCNSGHALTDAVLKGIGIVQLPDYYVQRHIKRGDLVTILDNYREPSEGIWPLYPQNRHLSPKIRLLVEFLSKKIKP